MSVLNKTPLKLDNATPADLEKFWQGKMDSAQCEFRPLARFVMSLLRMAITEAPVERVFSVLGHQVPKRRNRLLPTNVAALLQVRFREPFGKEPTTDAINETLLNTPISWDVIHPIQIAWCSKMKKGNEEEVNYEEIVAEEEKGKCAKCEANGVVGVTVLKCVGRGRNCRGGVYFCKNHCDWKKMSASNTCSLCSMLLM